MPDRCEMGDCECHAVPAQLDAEEFVRLRAWLFADTEQSIIILD